MIRDVTTEDTAVGFQKDDGTKGAIQTLLSKRKVCGMQEQREQQN